MKKESTSDSVASERKARRQRTGRVVTVAVCAAAAMVLSYVEYLLPPIYPALPAVKCGLANVAVIFTLYKMGKREAVCTAAVKVALTSLLFGSPVSFIYSMAGAALSLASMMLVKRFDRFSPVGVSVVGGVMHNAGQIIAAACIVGTPQIALYFPVLAVSGTLAGILVGALGAMLVKYVKI